jgi:hypothetical protein
MANMSNNLRSRMGRVGAIVAFTLLAAGALSTAPALASSACPNEQVRRESNINPTTGQPYSMGLPECRAYEMVTPPEKGGSDALAKREQGLPIAADGEAVEFDSQNAFGDAENYSVGAIGNPDNKYVARRSASGWTTFSALAPRRLASSVSQGNDASPEDLSAVADCGLTVSTTNSGSGTDAVCALREASGSWLATPDFPGLTGIPFRKGDGEALEYKGSSRDLSQIIFNWPSGAGGPLLPSATSSLGASFYEVSGVGGTAPKLTLVNVDNNGDQIGPTNEVSIGGHQLAKQECTGGGGARNGGLGGSSYQAISANGSTIYFTACPTGGVNTVYARVDGTSTIAISNPSPSQCTTCSATPAPAAYEGASADGSKAFFLTSQQLTNGDTDTTPDLYEYDFNNPPGKNLVDLSGGGAGDLTPGSGADVQGVVSVSKDGSHVFFVARGVLTTVPNGVGDVAAAGADNLYVANTVSGQTEFIAQLCSDASTSGAVSDPQCPATLTPPSLVSGGAGAEGRNDLAFWRTEFLAGYEQTNHPAQTTPDGRYLVFNTYAQLIASGPEADTAGTRDIYRYDSQTGQLLRVSVGESSFPASNNGNTPGMDARLAGLPAEGGGRGIGAFADINDWNRAISSDGSRIVFSTPQRLQADDVNTGTSPSCYGGEGITGCDVYEWHEKTGATSTENQGEVHMIADGQSDTVTEGAAGMSASGSDIFFFTHTPLVGQDADQLIDVYDARIGGGFPAPTPEPSCSGEACQGGASPGPAFGASGTSSFTGGGNLTPGSTSFPAPTAAGNVKITSAKVKGSALTLSVFTPSAGKLTASGPGVATVKLSVSKSGTYTLKRSLTKAGKASLRKHHRLTVKIKVVFNPSTGASSSATKTVTFKA